MGGTADHRKLLAALREAARQQGWTERETKEGVWFVPPDKEAPMVMAHHTPSDHRAADNLIAQLRRSGLIWPWLLPDTKGAG